MTDERKKILQMLKNGEITIDEANKLLEDLEMIQSEKSVKQEKVGYEVSPYIEVASDHNEPNPQKSTFASATDKLMSFFDTAVKKIKDLELDFYHSVEVEHIIQKNSSDFKEIYIHIPYGSVNIVPWDIDDVRMECKGKVFRTEDPNEGKEKLLENIDYTTVNNVLSFVSREKLMKVDLSVMIPKKNYDNLTIKLFNGGITVENLQSKKMNLNTANGSIRMVGLKGLEAEVETVNGMISVINNTFEEFEAETVNGKVNIDGNYKRIDIKTIGGTINGAVKNSDADTIRMESATGSVYIKLPEDVGLTGELKTNLGTLHVDIENTHVQELKKDAVQKISKFERIGIEGSTIYVFAESKMGSVFVQSL